MDTIRIDDPRLDESFSFLFAFRKGDGVLIKSQQGSRGEVTDGVYIGDFPKHVAGVLNPRGLTVYEVKTANDVLQIVDEKELQKVQRDTARGEFSLVSCTYFPTHVGKATSAQASAECEMSH